MELPRPRILVVEDDACVSRLMLRWLAAWGWEAEEAHSAAAALECFDRYKYDAVLCDVDLPDGDGIVLAGAFVKRSPALIVVIASGSPANLDRARLAGLNEVLEKPLEVEALRTLLERKPGFFPA